MAWAQRPPPEARRDTRDGLRSQYLLVCFPGTDGFHFKRDSAFSSWINPDQSQPFTLYLMSAAAAVIQGEKFFS